MERETLLTVLIILMGGITLHAFPMRARTPRAFHGACEHERAAWIRLWRPLLPVLLIAAWLVGWALSSPDPVPAHVGVVVFAGCAPFALLFARAALRALWALGCESTTPGIATVGLCRPRIHISAELAALLDPRELHAAIEHERAHQRHHDPLRIWLAQLVTDLQWPRAAAALRFKTWLIALEQARDEEARRQGADGADLAAAVLSSLRYETGRAQGACAALTGDSAALRERIARLLQPLPPPAKPQGLSARTLASLLIPLLSVALMLGVAFGGRIVGALLALTV
jgi:hypothetical protein